MQILQRCLHCLKFALFLFPLLVTGLTVHTLLDTIEPATIPPLQEEARLMLLPDGEETAVSHTYTNPTLTWLADFWQKAGLWLLLLASGFVMIGLLLKTPSPLPPHPIPKQAYEY